MSSVLVCPKCKRKLKVSDTTSGKAIRCPACKATIPAAAPHLAPEDGVERAASARDEITTGPANQPAGRKRVAVDRGEDGRLGDDLPVGPSPIRKRSWTGLILGLVLGGGFLVLVLVGCTGLIVYLTVFRGRDGTIPNSEWQTFAPANGGFTVLMPGAPVNNTEVIKELLINKYEVIRNKDNMVFEVGYADLGPKALPPGALEAIVHAQRGAVARKINGEVTGESPASLGAIRGHELRFVGHDGGILITRTYLGWVGGGHRVFTLVVRGSSITPGKGDTARFLDSFQLDSSVLPPSLPAGPMAQGPQPPVGARPPVVKPPPPVVARRPVIKPPPAPTDLPGLLAYWALDEESGGRAADSAPGAASAATVHGGKWVKGVRGGALELDGVKDYVDFGSAPALNFKAGAPFTFAGWVRTARPSGTVLSLRSSKDGGPLIDLFIDDGRLKAQVREDGKEFGQHAEQAGGAVSDGGWHHFALTRTGTAVELCLDGASLGRAAGSDAGGPITTDLRALGSERVWAQRGVNPAEQRFLRGALDEVCVFGRALGADEIKKLASVAP
jgi:hypothetical protein